MRKRVKNNRNSRRDRNVINRNSRYVRNTNDGGNGWVQTTIDNDPVSDQPVSNVVQNESPPEVQNVIAEVEQKVENALPEQPATAPVQNTVPEKKEVVKQVTYNVNSVAQQSKGDLIQNALGDYVRAMGDDKKISKVANALGSEPFLISGHNPQQGGLKIDRVAVNSAYGVLTQDYTALFPNRTTLPYGVQILDIKSQALILDETMTDYASLEGELSGMAGMGIEERMLFAAKIGMSAKITMESMRNGNIGISNAMQSLDEGFTNAMNQRLFEYGDGIYTDKTVSYLNTTVVDIAKTADAETALASLMALIDSTIDMSRTNGRYHIFLPSDLIITIKNAKDTTGRYMMDDTISRNPTGDELTRIPTQDRNRVPIPAFTIGGIAVYHNYGKKRAKLADATAGDIVGAIVDVDLMKIINSDFTSFYNEVKGQQDCTLLSRHEYFGSGTENPLGITHLKAV